MPLPPDEAVPAETSPGITVLIASNKLGNLGLHFVGVPKCPIQGFSQFVVQRWCLAYCLEKFEQNNVSEHCAERKYYFATKDMNLLFCRELWVRWDLPSLVGF